MMSLFFLGNTELPVELPKIKDGESPKPLSQNKDFFDIGPSESRFTGTNIKKIFILTEWFW